MGLGIGVRWGGKIGPPVNVRGHDPVRRKGGEVVVVMVIEMTRVTMMGLVMKMVNVLVEGIVMVLVNAVAVVIVAFVVKKLVGMCETVG